MNFHVSVTQLEQLAARGQCLHFGPLGSRSVRPYHFHWSLLRWPSEQRASRSTVMGSGPAFQVWSFCLGCCLLQLSDTTVFKIWPQLLLPLAYLVSFWILLREFGLLTTLEYYS